MLHEEKVIWTKLTVTEFGSEVTLSQCAYAESKCFFFLFKKKAEVPFNFFVCSFIYYWHQEKHWEEIKLVILFSCTLKNSSRSRSNVLRWLCYATVTALKNLQWQYCFQMVRLYYVLENLQHFRASVKLSCQCFQCSQTESKGLILSC